jgi:hypothetical protein
MRLDEHAERVLIAAANPYEKRIGLGSVPHHSVHPPPVAASQTEVAGSPVKACSNPDSWA